MPKAKTTDAAAEPSSSAFGAQLPTALLIAFETNDRINRYLIESIPADAWQAKPPQGKGRTVAAIAAHMHNVRRMWLKASKSSEIPDELDKTKVTPAQAVTAMEESCRLLSRLMQGAMESDGRIKSFRPDVAGFFAYLIAHDAHHRGQIAMLLRQLGHPLPQQITFGMWEWGSR